MPAIVPQQDILSEGIQSQLSQTPPHPPCTISPCTHSAIPQHKPNTVNLSHHNYPIGPCKRSLKLPFQNAGQLSVFIELKTITLTTNSTPLPHIPSHTHKIGISYHTHYALLDTPPTTTFTNTSGLRSGTDTGNVTVATHEKYVQRPNKRHSVRDILTVLHRHKTTYCQPQLPPCLGEAPTLHHHMPQLSCSRNTKHKIKDGVVRSKGQGFKCRTLRNSLKLQEAQQVSTQWEFPVTSKHVNAMWDLPGQPCGHTAHLPPPQLQQLYIQLQTIEI